VTAGPQGWTVGLDLGSTAVKAVLLGPDGRVQARASRPSPLDEDPKTGRAEIPLALLRRAAEGALKEVLRQTPGPVTLGIASQRSSVALWDAATGKPLMPGISWRDRRVLRGWPHGRVSGEEVIRRTGLRLSPHYSAGKIARALACAPGVPDLKTAPLPSWLAWHWSAGRLHATDPTLAARMLLMNLRKRDWDGILLGAFHIPERALPRILPSRARYGEIQAGGRSMTLRAMIGDQQAAALALGASVDTGLVNLGTGAFLLVPTGRHVATAEGLLTTVLWSDRSGAHYALEGTVNSAGALFDWMRRRGRGDPARIPLPSPRTALGLPACLPALAGTGAPRWGASDRLRFVSERGETAPSAAAALLGVAYRLREIWDALPADRRPGALLAAGGLSDCRALVQAVADLLRVPVRISDEREATALGAALLARGLRAHPGRHRHPAALVVTPRDNREAGYRRWRRLFPLR
jgi:glycerol kinase